MELILNIEIDTNHKYGKNNEIPFFEFKNQSNEKIKNNQKEKQTDLFLLIPNKINSENIATDKKPKKRHQKHSNMVNNKRKQNIQKT